MPATGDRVVISSTTQRGRSGRVAMARYGQLFFLTTIAIVGVAVYYTFSCKYGSDKQAVLEDMRLLSEKLGKGSIPLYIGIHALLISLCLPYAVVMEAGAAYLFGFFHGVLCVFFAKILSASLSFWIGRTLFRSSTSARRWVEGNQLFRVISEGVARDGWKFVLLARFSPMPSYIINYTLAATKVSYLVDFLLPSALGCIPMIIQNTSLGSLTKAATSKEGTSSNAAYLLPAVGLVSSILIAWRIKKYTSGAIPPITPDTPSNGHATSHRSDTPELSTSSDAREPTKSSGKPAARQRNTRSSTST